MCNGCVKSDEEKWFEVDDKAQVDMEAERTRLMKSIEGLSASVRILLKIGERLSDCEVPSCPVCARDKAVMLLATHELETAETLLKSEVEKAGHEA